MGAPLQQRVGVGQQGPCRPQLCPLIMGAPGNKFRSSAPSHVTGFSYIISAPSTRSPSLGGGDMVVPFRDDIRQSLILHTGTSSDSPQLTTTQHKEKRGKEVFVSKAENSTNP